MSHADIYEEIQNELRSGKLDEKINAQVVLNIEIEVMKKRRQDIEDKIVAEMAKKIQDNMSKEAEDIIVEQIMNKILNGAPVTPPVKPANVATQIIELDDKYPIYVDNNIKFQVYATKKKTNRGKYDIPSIALRSGNHKHAKLTDGDPNIAVIATTCGTMIETVIPNIPHGYNVRYALKMNPTQLRETDLENFGHLRPYSYDHYQEKLGHVCRIDDDDENGSYCVVFADEDQVASRLTISIQNDFGSKIELCTIIIVKMYQGFVTCYMKNPKTQSNRDYEIVNGALIKSR